MNHLYVRVRLHGTLVEERVLRVWQSVRLGEADDAAVSFPGADLVVQRAGGRLTVRGSPLPEEGCFSLWFGAVRVELETVRIGLLRRFSPLFGVWPDMRLLVATTALAMLGAFVDSVHGFAVGHPALTAEISGLLDPYRSDAPASRAAKLVIEGEPHLVEVHRPEPGPTTTTFIEAPVVVFEPGSGVAE